MSDISPLILTCCSDSAGWSGRITFRTPPAGGSDELMFIAFGDMGKAPRDPSLEHFIQVRQNDISIFALNINFYLRKFGKFL